MKFIKTFRINTKDVVKSPIPSSKTTGSLYRKVILSLMIMVTHYWNTISGEEVVISPNIVPVVKPVVEQKKAPIVRVVHHPKPRVIVDLPPSPSPPQNFVPATVKRSRKSIILTNQQILSKLSSSSVKNPTVLYDANVVTFSGKYKVGPFRVPFKMVSRFTKNGNSVGLLVSSLYLNGKEETGSRLDRAKDKVKSLFKVSNDDDTDYEITVTDKDKTVYTQEL